MALPAVWRQMAVVALMALTTACSDTLGGPSVPGFPLGVLGDSNSHSYQDAVSFPPGSGARGGPYHVRTFQWTEVLARLRPQAMDLGPWETSGHSVAVGYLRALLGLPVPRIPRKQDYRYNFANSGAPCRALNEGLSRQVPHLLSAMAAAPERWARGAVVLRIGMADIAQPEVMDALARDPGAARPRGVIDTCLRHIERATAEIRAAHPKVHIVLVGIFDDANDPHNFDKWHARAALDGITRGLDRYDAGLRALAARTPGTSFFDDRAWFRRHWGERGPQGETGAYRTVRIGDRLAVTHSRGDAPTHALLADDHPGLAWNALWAQALTQHLRDAARLAVMPLTDVEVEHFVSELVRT